MTSVSNNLYSDYNHLVQMLPYYTLFDERL